MIFLHPQRVNGTADMKANGMPNSAPASSAWNDGASHRRYIYTEFFGPFGKFSIARGRFLHRLPTRAFSKSDFATRLAGT
jgi:hypothetical protein